MEPQLPVNSPFTAQPGAATPPPVSSPSPSAPKPSMTHHLIFGLIGLAVVALAAGAVYYFENNKVTDLTNQLNTAKTSLAAANKKLASASASTTSTSASSLTTGVLTNEKITFSYPNTWKLSDTQAQAADAATQDNVAITAPDGFAVNIAAGVDGLGGACPNCSVLSSKPITSLGQKLYANFASPGGDTVDKTNFNYIYLANDPTCFFICDLHTKNILSSGQPLALLINASVAANGSSKLPISSISTNADVAAVEAIFASMHY